MDDVSHVKGMGDMVDYSKKIILLFICCLSMSVCQAGNVFGEALIIDHTCTDINDMPDSWVQEAKARFRIAYGHTSHGSQLVSGMTVLRNTSSLYDFNSTGTNGALSLQDSTPSGDLGSPNRTEWAARTRTLLSSPSNNRNMIMWSWCGQVSNATEEDIATYLSLMNGLEADYPDVTFVYMTGHLDGTGETGNLNVRNNQIRTFCIQNNKVLFDFADIESYDPDGNYFLDKRANDNCDYYDGSAQKNWAQEWCIQNPGECPSCSCAHSQSLNCDRKGRAFWYMLAKLSGWHACSVNAPSNLQAAVNNDQYSVTLTWTHAGNATGFVIQRQVNDLGWDSAYETVDGRLTSFTDQGLSANVYHYRVFAQGGVDEFGASCHSGYTSTVTATFTEHDAPVAPTSLNVSADAVNKINTLCWHDASDDEDGFYVARRANNEDWNNEYALIARNVTGFVDRNLAAGEYTYRVLSFNDYGTSTPSNTATGVISEVTVETPVPPSDIEAELDGNVIKLVWADNSDTESNFILQRKKDSGSFCSIATLSSNTTQYTDSDILSGYTYTYRVKAKNQAGYSGFSNEASVFVSGGAFSMILKQKVDGYEGCKDTYLDAGTPDKNYGTTYYKYVMANPQSNFAISFDLPETLNGKQISEAKLVFFCWSVSNWSDGKYLKLYEITESWDVLSATWNKSDGETVWTTPGGSIDLTQIGQSLIPKSSYYPEFDITELVQSWVDGDKENLGVLLKNDTTVTTGIKASEYSEYGRPCLKISFSSGDPSTDPVEPEPNTRPTAVIHIENSDVKAGDTVHLDGSNSTDSDEDDTLSFSWQLISKPQGSTAALSSGTNTSTEFVADKAGSYGISLVVNDGEEDSNAAMLTIDAVKQNTKPVAALHAENNQVKKGESIKLNALQSVDEDGDALSYKWMILSKPRGSVVDLSALTSASIEFIADMDGEFTIQLTVNDGEEESDPARVTITSIQPAEEPEPVNTKPMASINTSSGTVNSGETVSLDAGNSADADGDTLTCVWSLVSKPVRSAASLTGFSGTSTAFTADLPGAYVASLIVNDGKEDSDPVTVTITATQPAERPVTVTNAKPVARIDIDSTQVVQGNTVSLSGQRSIDNEGDALTYAWQIVVKPDRSSAAFSDPTSATPQFIADMPGEYTVMLTVNDGTTLSDPVMGYLYATAVNLYTAENHIEDAVTYLENLDSSVFKSEIKKQRLLNVLQRALGKVERGRYKRTLLWFDTRILNRMDGCINGGAPDLNDWVMDCETQQYLYNLITSAIEEIK
ncbi:MAG: DNRLRE domain-containing protein [Proteobacteria bacterium]|nr:DNRLRE domain-containing protein [Pseudomonadota bacterium]